MMNSLALTLLAATPAAQGSMPAGMPGAVGSGVISGGWGYVWAAYGVFWIGLGLYALTLILRSRSAHRESKEQV